jgi:hypothetical protein
MNYAELGTVSHGTLRNEDLLDSFASELEYWCSDAGRAQRDKFMALVDAARQCADPDSEEAGYIVEELFDALNTFAPEGYYFGANEGDGSDFGYWPVGEG